MRILVLGASGLLGSHVMKVARQAGHSVWGTFRHFPLPGLVACDCADLKEVRRLADQYEPQAVLHTAGWAWVDGCEDDPARAIEENALQPERIAGLCSRRDIHFSFVSSSYVFDGRSGPYNESGVPNPINVYGRSKLEGERRVLEAGSRSGGGALVARAICLYGGEARKKNFAWQVLKAMQTGATLRLPSDQQGNPTCAGDFARWLLALVEQGQRGLFHLAGPHPDCTRPEWARMLAAAFQSLGQRLHPKFAIEEVPTSELHQRAPRPLRAGMISSRLNTQALRATPFEETVRQMQG
jgi:dTDP-4-dehydrorhamnose reductase